MSNLDISGLYEVHDVVQGANSTLQCSALDRAPTTTFYDAASQLVSSFSLWRVIVLLLVLGNVKNLPLIWHVSISVH
jgi:hypothetical protein